MQSGKIGASVWPWLKRQSKAMPNKNSPALIERRKGSCSVPAMAFELSILTAAGRDEALVADLSQESRLLKEAYGRGWESEE